MKKPLALAGLSAFMLIGAAYPDPAQLSYAGTAVVGQDHGVAPVRYRPCRGRNDDRCIQLSERGVRAAYAEWLGEREPGRARVQMASADGRHGADHRAHRDHRGHRMHGRQDRRTHDVRCPQPERGELG